MAIALEHVAVIGPELALLFSDGREVYLPLPMLRRACPCAVCQGEPDALGRIAKPTLTYGPQAFELRQFVPVGGYALQFFWADHHNSGIYSFDYLRKLGAII